MWKLYNFSCLWINSSTFSVQYQWWWTAKYNFLLKVKKMCLKFKLNSSNIKNIFNVQLNLHLQSPWNTDHLLQTAGLNPFRPAYVTSNNRSPAVNSRLKTLSDQLYITSNNGPPAVNNWLKTLPTSFISLE